MKRARHENETIGFSVKIRVKMKQSKFSAFLPVKQYLLMVKVKSEMSPESECRARLFCHYSMINVRLSYQIDEDQRKEDSKHQRYVASDGEK